MAAKRKPAEPKIETTHTGEWAWTLGSWTIGHRSDDPESFSVMGPDNVNMEIARADLAKLLHLGARALSDTASPRHGDAKSTKGESK